MLIASALFALSVVQTGDDAFRKRHLPDQARLALTHYREAALEQPAESQRQWRVAMATQFVGMRLETDPQIKQSLFEEGKLAATRSLVDNEACAACHFWLAINQALYGESVGPFKMLFTLASVRSHLLRAAELDPGYAYGGPYRVLGVIARSLPGILGGSRAEAREYFLQAIAASPEEPMNHWELVQNLAEDDVEEAKAAAKRALQLPEPPSERVESRDAWSELRAWWESHSFTARQHHSGSSNGRS